MLWDRRMIFLNAAFLAIAGIGFAMAAQPIPDLAVAGPLAAGPTELLLGALLGGAGLGLLFLRRLSQPEDYRQAMLGFLVFHGLVALLTLAAIERPFWPSILVHAALAAGCCATAPWRKGSRSIEISQGVLLFSAAFLSILGYGGVAWRAVLPMEPGDTIRLLGFETAGVALALAILGNPSSGDDRRRLLLGLGAGNALGAAIALLQLNFWGFGSLLGWSLAGSLVLLAAGSVAAGLRPDQFQTRPGPPGLAEQLAGSHEAWLRQVSEAAAQEERNRLARDLHDSIKQQLFSIQVSAAAAQARWESDPEGARAAVADVRRGAQEGMVEMNALLQQLRPQALASLGLVEALREQCEALGYRTGAEVSLEIGEPVPDDRLPAGAQETIFRIAQEALSNVARHARARRVRVHLGRQGEEAWLQVEDDGQGFSLEGRTAGMGLRNLEERTAALRGHLEISSAPGQGVRIRVRVPLTPAVASEGSLAWEIQDQRRLLLRSLPAFALLLPGPWVSPILFSSSLGPIAGFFLFRALENGWKIHQALRRLNGEESGLAAQLLYQSRRTRAICLLGLAWALALIAQEFQGGWNTFWTTAMLLALAGMSREVLRAHRGSRPRGWSPSWVWPRGWKRSGAIAFLVGIACLLGLPACILVLEILRQPLPGRYLFPLAVALVAIYFHLRQPLTEGAPS